MPFSLALDVLVAVLLAVTISYAMVLNRKLSSFRRDKEELEKLANTFGETMKRTGDSISALKSTAGNLQEQIGKAQALRDDLVFLIDRSTSSADRLEEIIRGARKEGGFGPRQGIEQGKKDKETKMPIPGLDGGYEEYEENEAKLRSDAERELLKAIRAAR